MTDGDPIQRLREIDRPIEPRASFADALYLRLEAEAARRPLRRGGQSAWRAAAVVLSVAVGGTVAAAGIFLTRPPEPILSPSPSPLASPSERPPTPSPSAPPAGPSASVEIAWGPESSERDWPGPLRPETPGSPPDIELADPSDRPTIVRDTRGDVPGAAPAWIDITEVRRSGSNVLSLHIAVAAWLPQGDLAQPARRWIAYGVVLDVDGDRSADLRIGLDNASGIDHREWVTDLATGETDSRSGPPWGGRYLGTFIDTYFPGEGDQDPRTAHLLVGRQADAGRLRLYLWASTIEDGRLLGTDFAPDVGWFTTERP